MYFCWWGLRRAHGISSDISVATWDIQGCLDKTRFQGSVNFLSTLIRSLFIYFEVSSFWRFAQATTSWTKGTLTRVAGSIRHLDGRHPLCDDNDNLKNLKIQVSTSDNPLMLFKYSSGPRYKRGPWKWTLHTGLQLGSFFFFFRKIQLGSGHPRTCIISIPTKSKFGRACLCVYAWI